MTLRYTVEIPGVKTFTSSKTVIDEKAAIERKINLELMALRGKKYCNFVLYDNDDKFLKRL